MSPEMARWIFGILLSITLLGCFTFGVLYSRWFSWWKSEAGRHLFSFAMVLGAVDAVWLIALLAKPGWASTLRWLLILAYAPEPVVIWWRVSMMTRVHRKDVARPYDNDESRKGTD